MVANLQLQPGDYVPAGQPVIALVADRAEIVADFREKSLRHVNVGDEAQVVFDALPGTLPRAALPPWRQACAKVSWQPMVS